jgi:hypothetical protein
MPQSAFGPLAKATVEVKGVVLVGDTDRVNRNIANIVEVNRGTQRLLRHRKTPCLRQDRSRRNASVCCIGLEMFEPGNNSHYAKYITG